MPYSSSLTDQDRFKELEPINLEITALFNCQLQADTDEIVSVAAESLLLWGHN
jgi:hypothetical protein